MPFSVWVTSGWNCTAYRPRSGSSIAAIGMTSVCAPTRNPSGSRTTASPWLIHTCSVACMSASSTPGRSTVSVVRPYSRWPVAATSPPSACAMSWCP